MHRKEILTTMLHENSSNNDPKAENENRAPSSSMLKRKHEGELTVLHSSAKKLHTKPTTLKEETSASLAADDDRLDPRGVYLVQKNVKSLMSSWGSIVPVPPDYFLQRLLESRGYVASQIPTMKYKKMPSPGQVADYDNELVWAIRNSELPRIKVLYQSGRSMSACNKFSESIVHMACRRAELDVIDFILNHGGDVNITDDYGRTPLHDAFWRIEPRFDVVTMLLDLNTDLIRLADARGNTPLQYVREEHWNQWCAYLYHQRERYWPVTAAAAAVVDDGESSSIPSSSSLSLLQTETSTSSTSSNSSSCGSPTDKDGQGKDKKFREDTETVASHSSRPSIGTSKEIASDDSSSCLPTLPVQLV